MGTHQSHSTKQKGTKRREGRNDKQGNHCGASCGGTCKLYESRSDAEPDHGSGNTEGYLQVHVRGLERRGRRSCRVCRYPAGFAESAGPVGWKVTGRGCRRLPLHGILHRKAGAHLRNWNGNYRQRCAGGSWCDRGGRPGYIPIRHGSLH